MPLRTVGSANKRENAVRMRRLCLVLVVMAGLSAAALADAAGFELSPMQDDADFAAGNAAVREGRWKEALPPLLKVEARVKTSADVYNLLGVTYRKLKDYDTAKRHYDRALQIDPNHLPTLEYQGEWFVETGDMAQACANLARLKQLCGECHEYRDLAATIAAVK